MCGRHLCNLFIVQELPSGLVHRLFLLWFLCRLGLWAPVLNLLKLDGSLNYSFGSFTTLEPGLVLNGVDKLLPADEIFLLLGLLLYMTFVNVVIGIEDPGNSLLLAIHQCIIFLPNHLRGLLDGLHYRSTQWTTSCHGMIVGALLVDDVVKVGLEDVTEVFISLQAWRVEWTI